MFPTTKTTALALAAGTLLILLKGAHATPAPSGTPSRRQQQGTFVSDIAKCPKLTPRKPTSVHDLRPDDFSVTLAVGDSITAGAFAKGLQWNPLENLSEWRGVSYAAGGDPGAITVPNLIKNYNKKAVGSSTGRNIFPEICFGPLCPIGRFGWNSDVDN
jgi:phospholipase B1